MAPTDPATNNTLVALRQFLTAQTTKPTVPSSLISMAFLLEFSIFRQRQQTAYSRSISQVLAEKMSVARLDQISWLNPQDWQFLKSASYETIAHFFVEFGQ